MEQDSSNGSLLLAMLLLVAAAWWLLRPDRASQIFTVQFWSRKFDRWIADILRDPSPERLMKKSVKLSLLLLAAAILLVTLAHRK